MNIKDIEHFKTTMNFLDHLILAFDAGYHIYFALNEAALNLKDSNERRLVLKAVTRVRVGMGISESLELCLLERSRYPALCDVLELLRVSLQKGSNVQSILEAKFKI